MVARDHQIPVVHEYKVLLLDQLVGHITCPGHISWHLNEALKNEFCSEIIMGDELALGCSVAHRPLGQTHILSLYRTCP
jgi:hypothetical protein